MKPFFCRVGSKRDIVERLLPLFPEHRIYVEPFIGGGAVFFKKEPSEVEVINDLDKDLIRGYRTLKTLTNRDFPTDLNTIPKLQAYLEKTPRSKKIQLVQEIIASCNGFVSGIRAEKVYKKSDP
jgi:site-specific DNA-adenine methylase